MLGTVALVGWRCTYVCCKVCDGQQSFVLRIVQSKGGSEGVCIFKIIVIGSLYLTDMYMFYRNTTS